MNSVCLFVCLFVVVVVYVIVFICLFVFSSSRTMAISGFLCDRIGCSIVISCVVGGSGISCWTANKYVSITLFLRLVLIPLCACRYM